MPRARKVKKPYRSRLEEYVAAQLERYKIEFEYEGRNIFYLRRVLNGQCPECGSKRVVQRRKYIPDFISKGIILEAKGILDAPTRAKMRGVQEANPGLEIRFIFGANNKLNKNKEARYSDWCKENNFKYCVKDIPKEWVAEFGGKLS